MFTAKAIPAQLEQYQSRLPAATVSFSRAAEANDDWFTCACFHDMEKLRILQCGGQAGVGSPVWFRFHYLVCMQALCLQSVQENCCIFLSQALRLHGDLKMVWTPAPAQKFPGR